MTIKHKSISVHTHTQAHECETNIALKINGMFDKNGDILACMDE